MLQVTVIAEMTQLHHLNLETVPAISMLELTTLTALKTLRYSQVTSFFAITDTRVNVSHYTRIGAQEHSSQ
jgi:hypothetical protein